MLFHLLRLSSGIFPQRGNSAIQSCMFGKWAYMHYFFFLLTTDSCVQLVQYTNKTTTKAADTIVRCKVRLHFHRTCRRQGLNCFKLYPLAVCLPYLCSFCRSHGRHRTEPSRKARHRVAAGKVHLRRLTVQPHADLPFPYGGQHTQLTTRL